MLAYKVKKNNVNALMNESRRKFYHNFIRIIATVSATYFWQQRSYSTRGITGRCIHLWTISVTWQINWELSLFRKLRPLVPISITWRKGYQHSPMTTPKYHLPPLANLASLRKRRFTSSSTAGYADWPWNGSGRIWRKEVSESPLTDLFQSALVWSVVSHKGLMSGLPAFSHLCIQAIQGS